MVMGRKSQRKGRPKKTSSLPLAKETQGKFDVLPCPIKSYSDKKKYKVIRLENGLTACLISDLTDDKPPPKWDSDSSESESGSESSENELPVDEDDFDKKKTLKKGDDEEEKLAAAALCVGVGSFSDPKEVPGLAHFLEHMVFMGSKKFPKENDFDEYIKKHGGSNNASTDYERTTFHFECFEKYLYKSMDKFAQFFISPLLKKESMTRERESVESEFQMSITSDHHRQEQLLISLAAKESPVNCFSWGNKITLENNVTDDRLYELLHRFREQHYSAHRMTLAVQARLPLPLLERYVVNCFSNIPSNGLPGDDLKSYNEKVFDNPRFKKFFYIKPVKELNEVELTWMLPSAAHLYKSKPIDFVSWLVLHEGPGSLLSYLKKNLWAITISGDCDEVTSCIYTHFSINITLTEQGCKSLVDVIEAVFSYIKMLKSEGPNFRIFKEVQLIEEMSFRFQEEDEPADVVEDLVESMQLYPPEDYLTGGSLYFKYDPDEITKVVDHLVPENMNVMVLTAHTFDDIVFDKEEPWFKTKYTERDFSEEWMRRWKSVKQFDAFHLPNENEFITNDFSLLPDDYPTTLYPEKIIDNSLAEVWYKRDKKFKLPYAYYYYYIISPHAIKSAKNSCLVDLFVACLTLNLAEEGYEAVIAELSFKVIVTDKGIGLDVFGYNQKLPVLIKMIAKYITNVATILEIDMFDVLKDKLRQSYNNKILKPSVICRDMRLSILQKDYHAVYDKHSALNEVTVEDFKEFSSVFLKQVYIKALIQGNVEKSVAHDTTNELISILKCQPLEPDDIPKVIVHEIPKGERCCRVISFDKHSPISYITNYFQTGLLNLKDNAIADLFMYIVEEPLFNILRTKEQLGYDVSNSVRDTYGVLGFTFTVQAEVNKFNTDYVDSRIETCLLNQYNEFKSKGRKKFQSAQKGLIKLKQCTDVDLEEEVDRNWSEITGNKYMFDRQQHEIKAIAELKFEDVEQWWYNNSTFNKDKQFRKISFQVVGNPQELDSGASEAHSLVPEPLVAKVSNQSDAKEPAVNGEADAIYESVEAELPEASNVKTEGPTKLNSVLETSKDTYKLQLLDTPEEIKLKGDDYFIKDVARFRKDLPHLIKF